MPRKVYDHHKKAGNQGDVIKQVALIAALDKVLDEHRALTFCYADIYAGYAHNPLIKGNEWKHGIGKLWRRQKADNNQHTAMYSKWYLSRPQLVGGMYPGSSLIASDMCASKGKNVSLSLWDNSPSVIADLSKVFHGQGHSIFSRPADLDDSEVQSAHFLLIDPPSKDDYGSSIRGFLKRPNQAVLLWLPVNAIAKTPPREDKESARIREDVRSLGFAVTKVRWYKGGRTIGCQLVYRLRRKATRALRSAIEQVVRIAGWKCKHYG